MTHLSELRNYRKIAEKALGQYPLTPVRIDYISFTENVIYKVTAKEGEFLLRVHASALRTTPAIDEELLFIAQLRNAGFELQKPLATKKGEFVAQQDEQNITILAWQNGRKKHKSITDKDIETLGHYMAKLHDFSSQNNANIAYQNRDEWSPDNLIGDPPILGSFDKLETVKGFDRKIFEDCRAQTLNRLRQHVQNCPELQGMIHADLHFSNIIWQQNKLLAIDFDDCGQGSFLYDLAIPIITMRGDKPKHHRDILLNAYCQTRSLNESDLQVIDDYILARRITMQGWLLHRSSSPHIKKHLDAGMGRTMEILKASL